MEPAAEDSAALCSARQSTKKNHYRRHLDVKAYALATAAFGPFAVIDNEASALVTAKAERLRPGGGVDQSKYTDADWERLKLEAAEGVLARSLKTRGRVAKPGSQDWTHEEVGALLAKLGDPHTRHLKPGMLGSKVQADEGRELGLGLEVHRARRPQYLPLATQHLWRETTGGSGAQQEAAAAEPGAVALRAIASARSSVPVPVLGVSALAEVALTGKRKRRAYWAPTIALAVGGATYLDAVVDCARPLVVHGVAPGSAAQEEGVKVGDHVLRVGSRPYNLVSPHMISDGHRALNAEHHHQPRWRLAEGQSLDVLVWTPPAPKSDAAASAQPRPVSLTERPVERMTVESEMKRGPGGALGYMHIRDFSKLTGQEAQDALSVLIEEGAQGIVLDLRDNPGGSIGGGVEIPSLFLPPNTPVMVLEDANGQKETVNTRKCAVKCWDLPLVVLADGGSASSSEIIIGALKDHGRAVIVGENTYGKGLAQGLFPLSDGSGASVSIFRMCTPSGCAFQGAGIAPHKRAAAAAIQVETLDPAELSREVLPPPAAQGAGEGGRGLMFWRH
ncbi:ClpP/crotonase-like domain-containing protein [Tribonema minus]|uniref:ClpP/crotonase-like domain-containing protein n=1 Tax=Tribonema minus TaxID=303371 RepID=A0A836C928_9STRA|nr:ClpP/crotonase-like domain-containing protein [Tribonema minus]